MACLPPSWSSSSSKRSLDNDTTSVSNKKSRRLHDESISKLVGQYMREIGSAANENRADVHDDADIDYSFDPSIICGSVPFVKMLESFDTKSEQHNVPLVSRSYEEMYMRECKCKTELPCAMGVNCECMFIDPEKPFVAVRFPIPTTTSTVLENSLCLLCLRRTTQLLFYHVVHEGMHVNGLIQKHGNICDQPHEYHTSAMLICPPSSSAACMPLPIVAHQRNRYKIMKSGGIHWVKQQNVYYEDF